MNYYKSLAFWIFGVMLGFIGAFTNNLSMLLVAGLAIIVFNPRWNEIKELECEKE